MTAAADRIVPQDMPGHPRLITRVDRPVRVPGYLHGLRQSCVAWRASIASDIPVDLLAGFDRLVDERFPARAGHRRRIAKVGDSIVDRIASLATAILRSHGHPVFDDPVIEAPPGASPGPWTVLQPCLDFDACIVAVETSVDLLESALEPGAHAPGVLERKLDSLLDARKALLGQGRPGGFNAVHFLEAARALDVPWLRLSGGVFQFGVGASSRLLDSSFTDRTPLVSAALARDKLRAALVMREAGIPVPEHYLVRSADDATQAAMRLGYPVVVKPADQDGGVGVSALLPDAAAVAQAYARASKISGRILVERHVHGTDYRLQVVDGQVLGVIERAPGGVTGDGVHTMAELVERQNLERRNALDDRRFLHPIVADDEALSLLHRSRLDWSSVPAAGRFIRLRGAANVASGGVPVPMPVAEAHPDNVALAVRAVRILRLDVAGVDLLIPDIRVSWLESGAAICEVNAQPQMFTTLHGPTLRSLMRGGNGRIPVVIVLSSSPGERVGAMLHERLLGRFPSAGLVCAGETRIGRARVMTRASGSWPAGRALVVDPALDALVLSVFDHQVMRFGWPVDRCDAVVLAGGRTSGQAPAPWPGLAQLCRSAARLEPRAVFFDSADPVLAGFVRATDWPSARLVGDAGPGEGGAALKASAIADAVSAWLAAPT
jgi:cyanophycin synthetase